MVTIKDIVIVTDRRSAILSLIIIFTTSNLVHE